jgi:SAM-dependent methyltransferase
VNAPTVSTQIYKLIDAFADAPDDHLDTEFQHLTSSLWLDGAVTNLAHPAVRILTARLGAVDNQRKGYLAVLLGLLAESEYPASDGPLATAIGGGLGTYIGQLSGLGQNDPLGLALCYLLAHFPASRDGILTAAGQVGLNADDYSRLDRALAVLDPEHPVLGQVFPSPHIWELAGAEQDLDQHWTSALSPKEIVSNWEADTRTVLASLGAKAYWAVANGTTPARPAAITLPSRGLIPGASAPVIDLFRPHAAALRCAACGGGLGFGPHWAQCGRCAVSYPIAAGILDLTRPAAGLQADDSQHTPAEIPSMNLLYEMHARPNFLRYYGTNWGNAVTPAVEDEYIAQHVRPVDGPVLDLAAGAGRWTETLVKTVGADRVIALDLNPPMLSLLRGRLPEVPAIRAGATTLPFADASLGAVLCWNALQAFPAQARVAVAEVGRCLRPGGTFTLMTYKNSADPVYRHFVDSLTFPQSPGRPRAFDPSRLNGFLTDAGLRVHEEGGPGTFVFINAVRV